MSFTPADKPVYPNTDPFNLTLTEDYRIGLILLLQDFIDENWSEIEPDDFNALASIIESLDRYDRFDGVELRQEYADMMADLAD